MNSNERHQTWEIYIPADDKQPGKWCKQDYNNGEKVDGQYDYRYDVEDGFHQMTRPDGTIVEANYVDGLQNGQCKLLFTDGRIE